MFKVLKKIYLFLPKLDKIYHSLVSSDNDSESVYGRILELDKKLSELEKSVNRVNYYLEYLMSVDAFSGVLTNEDIIENNKKVLEELRNGNKRIDE